MSSTTDTALTLPCAIAPLDRLEIATEAGGVFIALAQAGMGLDPCNGISLTPGSARRLNAFLGDWLARWTAEG